MRRAALLLALSLGTVACTDLLGGRDKADDDDGDDDDGDWGGGGSGSDDGGGDDGGGDDGGSSSSACSNIFPLDKAGRELDYRYDSGDFVGEFTTSYDGKETYRGEEAWHLRSESWLEGTTAEYTSEYTLHAWYRCDDEGVWILGQELDQTTVNAGTTSEYFGETVYVEPGLVAARSVKAGDSWEYRYTYESTDNYGNNNTYSDALTYAVGAKESVTVPAGTFSAWPVTYVVSGETYGYLAAEDVGSVKSDAIELVEIHD